MVALGWRGRREGKGEERGMGSGGEDRIGGTQRDR